MSQGRPLSDGNLVTLGEVMVEIGVGRAEALRLVEGLPCSTLGRGSRWRWGDVLARALGTSQRVEEAAPAPVSVRRRAGDWC